ncbi:MAG: hypothetical protein ACP5E5_15115, partial [Acidobacteriaceae bacterium]
FRNPILSESGWTAAQLSTTAGTPSPLSAVCGRKLDFLTGLQKPANSLQTKLFCVVHVNVHTPA